MFSLPNIREAESFHYEYQLFHLTLGQVSCDDRKELEVCLW